MSVLYGTLQAHNDYKSEDIMSLLADEGITPPPGFKPGRFPTPTEMRNALESLNNTKITYDVNSDTAEKYNWQASVECDEMYVLISSVDFTGNENVPVHFYYQGYVQLITAILQKLTPVCGAFIFFSDSDPFNMTFILPETKQSE
jgi:hypothetical protein